MYPNHHQIILEFTSDTLDIFLIYLIFLSSWWSQMRFCVVYHELKESAHSFNQVKTLQPLKGHNDMCVCVCGGGVDAGVPAMDQTSK